MFYDERGNKTIATFNSEGELDGPYREYYSIQQDGTYQLKLEGHYGVRAYPVSYRSEWTGETTSYSYNIPEVRRIGEWKYYARDGRLLEVARYEWLGE